MAIIFQIKIEPRRMAKRWAGGTCLLSRSPRPSNREGKRKKRDLAPFPSLFSRLSTLSLLSRRPRFHSDAVIKAWLRETISVWWQASIRSGASSEIYRPFNSRRSKERRDKDVELRRRKKLKEERRKEKIQTWIFSCRRKGWYWKYFWTESLLCVS